MVARDSPSEVIWWARKVIPGRPQPSEGEALAVLHGIQIAAEKAWSQVIVEMDCLPVHRYLTRESCRFVSFGAVLDACVAF